MKLTRRFFLVSGAVSVCVAAPDPAWRARVAAAAEPGDRVVIRGRVLRTPGGAPASGAALMVYQTDAAGIYSRKEGHPKDTARLRAELKAGPNGEYEIVTIRPGHYPGGGVPAHIHVNLVEPSGPREICEFFFAGDKFLTGKEKGYVIRLERATDGTWRGEQDVLLEP